MPGATRQVDHAWLNAVETEIIPLVSDASMST
jgi:hypothetical protein